MKPLLTLTGALAALVLAAPALAAPQQVTLNVPTMDCATCPITIRVALMKVPGVSKAVVSYNKRTAKVSYDDAQTDVAALMRATEGVGYPSFKADEP
ncbi:mercury resistance system periplasmic binding protein MerP [Ideonella dechloratans]|uniref:mercury resistance system periplasmic binding protein MerP n=1 Tax=Ideonella dechloratans TaxID=36863 RepID=UPI0035AEE6FF